LNGAGHSSSSDNSCGWLRQTREALDACAIRAAATRNSGMGLLATTGPTLQLLLAAACSRAVHALPLHNTNSAAPLLSPVKRAFAILFAKAPPDALLLPRPEPAEDAASDAGHDAIGRLARTVCVCGCGAFASAAAAAPPHEPPTTPTSDPYVAAVAATIAECEVAFYTPGRPSAATTAGSPALRSALRLAASASLEALSPSRAVVASPLRCDGHRRGDVTPTSPALVGSSRALQTLPRNAVAPPGGVKPTAATLAAVTGTAGPREATADEWRVLALRIASRSPTPVPVLGNPDGRRNGGGVDDDGATGAADAAAPFKREWQLSCAELDVMRDEAARAVARAAEAERQAASANAERRTAEERLAAAAAALAAAEGAAAQHQAAAEAARQRLDAERRVHARLLMAEARLQGRLNDAATRAAESDARAAAEIAAAEGRAEAAVNDGRRVAARLAAVEAERDTLSERVTACEARLAKFSALYATFADITKGL
jgi:hypothetical protein